MSAVSRLASMDGRELRFRLACEARKLAGRLRHSVKPPELDRRGLARVLDPAAGPLVAQAIEQARAGNYLSAHQALGTHLATRASRWPLQSARRRAFVEELREAYPDAAADARRRADRILDGRYDLLGYRGLAIAEPPDWHLDVVHGRRAPLAHWTRVNYLDRAVGDHKITWEINRHQYFLTLGMAYWLTGDRRYRDCAVAHLEDWVAKNPPLQGINWTSMLELAFRTLAWTWAVEFFAADAASDQTPWLVDLFVSLDRQLTLVSQNLSRYFSPNTHLTGEALALYAVSQTFPELRRSSRRAEAGRAVLLDEARRQIHLDGGHVELSTHYHRYTTDFYLLALMVARAAGDPAAPVFQRVASMLADYLRTIADDRGVLPLIGDDDGGQLFAFGGRPADASSTLAAATALLADPALAVGAPREEAAWILGRRPAAVRSLVPWPSRTLPQSGYFVSRDGSGGHLVFDAGQHGYLNGGHAHADALSVILSVNGVPVLVDPGTATYMADSELRDSMRSPRMHNTVVLDGRTFAAPQGPFHWRTRTDARLLTACISPEWDFAVGSHDGYVPHRHTRAVLALHGIGWLIADRITGRGRINAEAWWHLHPDWQPTVCDGIVHLQSSDRCLALATTAPDVTIVNDAETAAYAPEYGRLEPASVIRAARTGCDTLTIGTFVPHPDAARDSLAMVELASEEQGRWVICPFGVWTGGREYRIDIAFPAGDALPSDWPQPCIAELKQSCVE